MNHASAIWIIFADRQTLEALLQTILGEGWSDRSQLTQTTSLDFLRVSGWTGSHAEGFLLKR